ncbi:FkbM family methyltransferase [Geovibrio thiophilus]|uniref:FkbM family methyltransferase n=1 Tax=Geovibrio thiophilus TaxID=139438 RepID=A0A410JV99_9BACT|nr:FkbM family methyltransferase [Geovibrio thiophilus]QAR32093.1 FkbM family methyltransferase [Geovibrio thiophilus]
MFKRNGLLSVLTHIKNKGVNPQTVIDVGVAYGTNGLYGVFDSVRYLMVEPLEEYKGVLDKIVSEYPAVYTLSAAGSREGSVTMNVHPDMSGSSVLKESEGAHVDGVERTVPVVTLDGETEKYGLKGPFVIKIDVQGFELEVLKGAEKILKETEIVIMEVSLFQFYKESPTFFDVVAFMNERNFSVYDIFGATYRPLDDALGQVDLVFVANGSVLRETHHYASFEQRKTLTAERVRKLNPNI